MTIPMSTLMNNAYLLDTNAAIARTNDDKNLIAVLSTASEVLVSSTVLGELYFGAYKSARVEENLRRVEEFIQGHSVLNCEAETARIYGRIRQQLRAKGRPIPENDIWIAAVALQHNLTLLTRDEHFKQIETLPQASW